MRHRADSMLRLRFPDECRRESDCGRKVGEQRDHWRSGALRQLGAFVGGAKCPFLVVANF